MKNEFKCLVTLVAVLSLAACQTGYNAPGASGGNIYSSSQINVTQRTNTGVIVSIQDAYVENNPNLLATLGGATVGGLAGSKVGKGSGKTVAKVVGALAGASVANQVVTGGVKKVKQITFKSDNYNQLYTVIQDDRNNLLYVGQRVLLQQDGRKTRVQPY